MQTDPEFPWGVDIPIPPSGLGAMLPSSSMLPRPVRAARSCRRSPFRPRPKCGSGIAGLPRKRRPMRSAWLKPSAPLAPALPHEMEGRNMVRYKGARTKKHREAEHPSAVDIPYPA
jgi:hypothetical protein